MAFVITGGQLQPTGPGFAQAFNSLPIAPAEWEYTEIWRTQPQVRTVVSFLARNIAQVGIHTFRRVSDTDRKRLTDHGLTRVLAEPMPRLTQYRLIERLVSDLAVYDTAYWIKAMVDGTLRLLPTPPSLLRPVGGSWLQADHYEAASGMRFEVDQVVHFHGYHPDDLRIGSSSLDALRSLLLEDRESSRQRAQMWRSGARMTGVLTRPAEAPEWSPESRVRFREMWRTFTQGGGAEGGTPILEDGMGYTQVSMNPQQTQYIESRKLTREEVAAAFHIPPPLVGILDHATYSNIVQQHEILYQDTLGPWFESIVQDIQAQLLPDIPDNKDVYCEFNIAAKMAGDFEAQAAAASTATGGPWMTRNEQRARMNLPSLEGGDELIVPLNVTAGGQASPTDTAPKAAAPSRGRALSTKASGRPEKLGDFDYERDQFARRLGNRSERQAASLLASVGVKDLAPPDVMATWEAGAADRRAELQSLIAAHGFRIAQVGAWEVLAEHNADAEGWSADVMLAWLLTAAGSHAEAHDAEGSNLLTSAVASTEGDWRDRVQSAMAVWAGSTAIRRAFTAATETRSFGGHDAAGASGLTSKVWRTGGSNPRTSHKALDGDKVQLDDVFGNGCRWPGDAHGKESETANCNCKLTYQREE
jgi:HK97 family phage portal protein